MIVGSRSASGNSRRDLREAVSSAQNPPERAVPRSRWPPPPVVFAEIRARGAPLDDEVDRRFHQARVGRRRRHEQARKREKAIDVLEDVVQSSRST